MSFLVVYSHIVTYEPTNLQTYKPTNSQTHKLTNLQTHKLTNPQIHKLLYIAKLVILTSPIDTICSFSVVYPCFSKKG